MPSTASPVQKAKKLVSGDTPRATKFPLTQNQLRGPQKERERAPLTSFQSKMAKENIPTSKAAVAGSGSKAPVPPQKPKPVIAPPAPAIAPSPPASIPSILEAHSPTEFTLLVASLAENAERLKALHTGELAIQESLIKALDFEKKRNTKLEDDIAELLEKIARLETEIRSQALTITRLSEHKEDSLKLKEERERRLHSDREVADLSAVIEKMAKELDAAKSTSAG